MEVPGCYLLIYSLIKWGEFLFEPYVQRNEEYNGEDKS